MAKKKTQMIRATGSHGFLALVGTSFLSLLVGRDRAHEEMLEQTRVRVGGILLIALICAAALTFGLPKIRAGETEASLIFIAIISATFILFIINLLISYADSIDQQLEESRRKAAKESRDRK
jgi:hypothetical protein